MTKTSTDDDWKPSQNEFAYAFALIGEFMFHWAVLESEINRSIHQLLNLDGPTGYITTANMGLRDKLNLVRTLLHFYCNGSDAWVKDANKELDKIGAMSAHRNLVAHTLFGPHKGGGVSFMTIKAKGKFDLPEVIWKPEDFDAKQIEIARLKRRLERLVATAVQVRTVQGHKRVLTDLFATNQDSGGLGILGLLLNQLQSDPGSHPTNPEIAPQTPQETEEK
jgi:hypothetical protein